MSLPGTASEASVVLSGNRALSEQQLLRRLNQKQVRLEELAQAGAEQLERAARVIRIYYQTKGYPLARVTWEKAPDGIHFRVVEGPRAELGEVRFEGNRELSAQQLLRASGWRGRLDVNRIEAGLDEIREVYRESGYREIELGEPLLEVVERTENDHFPLPFHTSERQQVRLTVPLREGDQFRFGRVDTDPRCEDAAYPESGRIYRPSRLAALRESLRLCFFEQGLMLQQLQVTERVELDQQLVHVRIAASILPSLEIARIEFKGNRRFPDGFYRRELEIVERDVLDPRKLEASLRRLLATGALKRLDRSDVELAVRTPEEVDVTITLHERKPRKVEFSLSPDPLGGIDMSLAYTVLNLIGLGEKLGLELRVGSHSSEVAVGVASRYLLGTQIPAALALRFFRRNTSFRLPGVEGPLARLLERDSWGFEGGGSYRISQSQRAGLGYSFERIRRPQSARHFSLSPHWRLTGPHAGGTSSIRLGQHFSFFKGQDTFGSLRHDLRVARTRSPERLDVRRANLRFHLAYAGFFGRAEPLFDRVFKDGFELRSFSPAAGPWAELADGSLQPVGGDLLWTFSSDYQFPLSRHTSLAPFFDIGVNRASGGLQPGRIVPTTNNLIRSAVGAEIRLRPLDRLPVVRVVVAWRPLRLDTMLQTAAGQARLREAPFAVKIIF